jgi:hypothetical protein
MAKRQILSVENMTLLLVRTDPAQLHITAQGFVSSSGWSNSALVLIDEKSELSPDGVLDFNFIAEPPSGISLPVITPSTASFVWTKEASRVVAVRVVARTNEKTELVNNPIFKTFAFGEETPVFPRPWPWPKMAIPERPPTKPPWIREIPPTGWFGEHGPFPSDPRGEDPHRPIHPDDPLFDPFPGGRGPFGGGGGL